MNKILLQIRGNMCLQLFATFSITSGMLASTFWWYNLAYLIQQPSYICTFEDDEMSDDQCTAANICDGAFGIIGFEIDFSNSNSILNWHQKLDLMCAESWKVNFLGAAYLIGSAVTVLWIPRLSDKSGRKWFYGAGVMIDFALFSAIFLVDNLDIMIGIMFCFGATNVLRTQIGLVYMMEFNPKNLQIVIGSLWGISRAFIKSFSTIYFWKISKNWLYIIGVGYGF